MHHFCKVAVLSAALIIPMTLAPTALRADDHRGDHSYHDKEHNDEHAWNNQEDRAYRMWAKENHRKYVAFSKLRDQDQQSYWGWRHQHSDALLKIEIH